MKTLEHYEDGMSNGQKKLGSPRRFIAAVSLVGVLAMISPAFAATAMQETFKTPDEAVAALISANRKDDVPELLKILGPDAEKLILSGDSVADKEGREKFLAAYDVSHGLASEGDNKDVLIIGTEEWPLPIPLVREGNKWRFDTKAGEDEILYRRIGRNELNGIEVCRAYVEAQQEYAAGHEHQYAQKFLSASGMHDGLYWPVAENEKESPLGPLIAGAEAEGYNAQSIQEKREPYHGYYYRILTKQGPDARGGARNYIADGRMTGGFALLAYPATYNDSGIMTFIVNEHGIVYEKNFGPNTAQIAPLISEFDPDETWKVVLSDNVASGDTHTVSK